MRYVSNFRASALLAALLVSNIALVSAVNCTPADDDGTPLTGSSSSGNFVTCTYQGAGPCTYFPSDGSFSSGASTCPPGLPQGDADADSPSPSTTTTPVDTETLTPTSTPSTTSEFVTVRPSSTTSTTPVVSTPSTTTSTQPPPTTRTTTETADAPPPSATTPASTPQASSAGVFTSSSPSVITATTAVIIGALVGLPNLLGIAFAYVSL